MLTFVRTENIQKIYENNDIMGMRVEVTPYRTTTWLPQCKNCQNWRHTTSYCHKKKSDGSNVLGSLPQWQAQSPKKLRQKAIIVAKIILLLHPPKKAMLIGRIADIVRSGRGPGFVS